MLAIVRRRRAVVSEVKPFIGERGVLHVVRLDYKDEHRPLTEEVIWELEPARRLLEPNELPRPSDPPMPTGDYDALVRASRWSAMGVVALVPRIMRLFRSSSSLYPPESAHREASSIVSTIDAPATTPRSNR